jgi:inner membrane protein
MDSFTKIDVGAAFGEVVLGEKGLAENDFICSHRRYQLCSDVLTTHFLDTMRVLEIRRRFACSIVVSFFAPIFGWIVTWFENYKDPKAWLRLFFCLQ